MTLSKTIAQRAEAPAPHEAALMLKLAASLITQFQQGKLDRKLLAPGLSTTLTPEAVELESQRLAPLGKPKRIVFDALILPGEYRTYRYRVEWKNVTALESFAIQSDGKIAAFQLSQVR